MAETFEAVAKLSPDPVRAARFLVKDVRALARERGEDAGAFPVPPRELAKILAWLDDGRINAGRGYVRAAGAEVREAVAAEVAAHPEMVAHVRAGREAKAVGFLMGRIMRRTQGRADPKQARALLVETLSKHAGPSKPQASEPRA